MWTLQKDIVYDTEFPFFHGVTTRALGNMRDPRIRQAFCRDRGVDFSSLTTAEQIHGNRVALVDRTLQGQEIAGADGLITVLPNVPLAIFTADCVPIFFGDERRRAVGVIHAGWRGLAKGIIARAVEMLTKECGIPAADLFAAIGPHIGSCCYTVGFDLKKVFKDFSPGMTLDLTRIACDQLHQEGIARISTAPQCTMHHGDLFFSYRREKSADRIMSMIELRGHYEDRDSSKEN